MPGQKGFSQNWAPFREDYTLIALVSAGKLLPAEPWDWERSLETLASLSKDTEPSTGAWGPVVIFHTSWLNIGLPFSSLWSGQEEGPRGLLGQHHICSGPQENNSTGIRAAWSRLATDHRCVWQQPTSRAVLALTTLFHLTSLFKQEKSGRLMVRK